MKLIDRVYAILPQSDPGISIPEISRRLRANEYAVLNAISILEGVDKAMLSGFDRLYREDGGSIYLALYTRKQQEATE